MFNVRPLLKSDYYKNFLQLLSQLTQVGDVTYEEFCCQVDKINSYVYVIEDTNTQKICATAAIFIEKKFIHNMSSVAHIEDVVVDSTYRGAGLGKLIIDKLIRFAKFCDCYKIILNCSQKNVEFYKKCGFIEKEREMALYLK